MAPSNIKALVLVIFLTFLAAPVGAESHCVEMNLPDLCQEQEHTRYTKLGRGYLNLLFLPLELPASIAAGYKDSGPIGATLGLGEFLLFRAVLRATTAVIDLVTFETPLPRVGYEPIPIPNLTPYVFEPLLK